jgi:hypothetical protein
MSDNAPAEKKNELNREETAFYIRTFWEALTTPTWTRETLIELGKVVFAKVPLNKLTNEQFAMLIPKLQEIAIVIGTKVALQHDNEAPAAPKPEGA